MLSEEWSDEFHVFPGRKVPQATRRRTETIQSRYTARKGKSPEIFLKATTIEVGLLLNFGRKPERDLYMIIKEEYQRKSAAE